jgi:membrane-bound lytic murein transglycosylase B
MKPWILALYAFLAVNGAAHADFDSCKERIKAQAAAKGMSPAMLARALDDLQPNDATSFLGKQPEFSTPIWDYVAGRAEAFWR